LSKTAKGSVQVSKWWEKRAFEGENKIGRGRRTRGAKTVVGILMPQSKFKKRGVGFSQGGRGTKGFLQHMVFGV